MCPAITGAVRSRYAVRPPRRLLCCQWHTHRDHCSGAYYRISRLRRAAGARAGVYAGIAPEALRGRSYRQGLYASVPACYDPSSRGYKNALHGVNTKELHVTYARRNRVVLLFTYACLVGMLTGPVHAQVKGRGADPGTKTSEPSAAPRQEAITVNAKSAVLMEGASGQTLAAQNRDEKIAPASFAKLLTLYVVYDTIRSGKIKLTDEVYISKKAWETGGSKMYVGVGSKVPLEEIIKGIAI